MFRTENQLNVHGNQEWKMEEGADEGVVQEEELFQDEQHHAVTVSVLQSLDQTPSSVMETVASSG